jgi:hypothetical protein
LGGIGWAKGMLFLEMAALENSLCLAVYHLWRTMYSDFSRKVDFSSVVVVASEDFLNKKQSSKI